MLFEHASSTLEARSTWGHSPRKAHPGVGAGCLGRVLREVSPPSSSDALAIVNSLKQEGRVQDGPASPHVSHVTGFTRSKLAGVSKNVDRPETED